MKGLINPLAAATILALTACGTEKTADEYLVSANQYIASGDKNSAVIELKNALRQASSNLQARVLLGDIYYEQGSFEAAEKEYAKAYQDGADANSIIPKLALTYFKSSKVKEIKQLADDAPRLSAESAATLSAVQALSMFKQGDIEQAKDYLTIAEQKQADNIYTRLGMATLAASTGTEQERAQQRDVALKTVESVLVVAPENIEANLLKGHLLMAQKQFELAEVSYRKVIELAPAAPQYAMYLLQCMMKQEKYEKAEPALDDLLTVAPSHPVLNEYKARILYSRQDFAGAKGHAEKAIQSGSTSISSFVVAGISSMKENQLEQAYRYLSQVQGSIPSDHLITRIYAYLQLQLGYTEEAVESLDRLTNLKESDAVLFASATAELAKSGEEEKALAFAEKAASLDESGANTVKLGILKLANEDKSGLDDLEKALKSNPELTEARLALVYSLLQQGEDQLAREAADDMVQSFPDDPRGYTLKGLVEKRLGNDGAALMLFDQALEKAPNDAIALLSKASVLVEQEKEPEAFELQKQNLKNNVDKPYVIRSFMAHASRFKRGQEAVALLEQEHKASPNNVVLTWAYSVGLVSGKQIDKAIKLLSALTEEQHIAPTRQLLGDLYIQSRQLDKAESHYEKWLEAQPNSPKVYQRLIAVNELQRDYSEALSYSQKGLNKFPKSQVFKLLEATMLYENGQVRAAGISLGDLNGQAAAHPVAVRLKARIAIHEKNYKEGLTLWQQYYEKQPSVSALVSLAKVYELNNQPEESVKLLEQDINRFPRKHPAHLKLAEIYMNSEPKKAYSHYEAALLEVPNNIIALNNIAYLLIEKGNYTKAEEHAKKAYELSKQMPVIADTYGQALLRQSKVDEALPILEAAYEAQSDNDELAIHYAEALIEKGNRSRAKSILSMTNPEDNKLIQLKAKLMSRL